MANIQIRTATAADADLLWRFLAIAAYEPDAERARSVPLVAAHLVGWPRAGDFGFVAEQAGLAIGAAWCRQFVAAENPTFHIDDCTPELSIAVVPQARGQGVGQALLKAIVAESGARSQSICLNVRHDNPAIRLYERAGFQRVPDAVFPNRVGGWSIGMWLPAPERVVAHSGD